MLTTKYHEQGQKKSKEQPEGESIPADEKRGQDVAADDTGFVVARKSNESFEMEK